jgi:small subunit ribosomal protein S1
MSNPSIPDTSVPTDPESSSISPASTPANALTSAADSVTSVDPPAPETESFDILFAQYESEHGRGKKPSRSESPREIHGTVIAVSPEAAYIDIGLKIEGLLPLSTAAGAEASLKPGDTLSVSIKGRDPESGYYLLSRLKVVQPTDWEALEKAFIDQLTIVGTVTGVVKGGFSVDIGVRAFMPASKSGVRDAGEMEKLVGQEIVCRILKIDAAEEDIVVDRRAVTEEQARIAKERRYAEVREGDVVSGQVRSLTDYGAFIDLGGVDGLLHIGDIAWSRIGSAADVLTVGQEIEAKVLKIDSEKGRISLGMKQLLPHPWDGVPARYKVGERVHGVVTRTADFGAFVEIEPGVEGLIHVSEMSWIKKVRKPSDIVKTGDTVEAVILRIEPEEKRMSLGLKQALGDPWKDAAARFPVGSQVQGPVTSMMKFGAFVQIAEGVEGMIHVSEISPDKHIHHPQDVFRVGQVLEAQVIGVEPTRRQIKLSIKQMIPTGLDEYLAEHKVGDQVTGRILDGHGDHLRVELGEGIFATCRLPNPVAAEAASLPTAAATKPDLSALSAMLKKRWKTGDAKNAEAASAKADKPGAGQIRSFRITKIDLDKKAVELELN